MVPKKEVEEESPREMEQTRRLAESLGLRFDEIVQTGSQGTVRGIKSKSILFSERLDSRTFFIQDVEYGITGKRGVLQADDEVYLQMARSVMKKLQLPNEEIAESNVMR